MWCGVVWCGVVWCGVVWCGVVWCGVVWCGVVWRGVAWRGVVWCILGCSSGEAVRPVDLGSSAIPRHKLSPRCLLPVSLLK